MAILLLSPVLYFLTLSLLLITISFSISFPKKLIHKHKKQRRSHSHGPPSFPLIGCLISFYRNRRCLLDWYTGLLSESPTQTIVVSRLGARRTIVTANPANVEYILKTNFTNFPKGKPLSDVLGDFLGGGIFNADGEVWHAQRKLASLEFSARSLREFVVRVLEEEVVARLVPALEATAETGGMLDVQETLRRFAFDTICQVALGVDPNCLGPGCNHESGKLVEAFDGASETSAARGSAPVSALWRIKRALNIGSERKLRRAVSIVRGSVTEIIRDRKNRDKGKGDGKGGADLLSRLLAAGHGEEAARDMVISFLMAGRDTTSSAMTWLFWLLTRHRSEEARAVEEATASFREGSALDFEALKGMRFTTACIYESMRLFPPVAWDSKHAASGDILPDGTPVRAGDRVTYFPYGMGRMEALWGEDRLEFRPDRWFWPGGSEMRPVSPFEYPVFQAGPRVCLGKEMAMVQMKYVVATVLSRFVIRPVRTEPPVFVPLLTAHMAGGFEVTVRKRKSHR